MIINFTGFDTGKYLTKHQVPKPPFRGGWRG